MKYSVKFYNDVEKLTYSVYGERKYEKPANWKKLKVYENKRNGFYAEAYQNSYGQVVLVYRGTDTGKGLNELKKDLIADYNLLMSKLPEQAYDAYNAYRDLDMTYGNVIIAGYSLGGSMTQIICNETGAEGITYAAYGVGNIVTHKNAEDITNFGNESDPIFNKNITNHIGSVYIIPDERDLMHKGSSFEKHMPGNLGNLSSAVQYSTPIFKLHASYNNYDDNILVPSNRVFYKNELPIRDMDEATLDQILEQSYEEGSLPEREELERRVRFGELIYVHDYYRADGTKVSGYYRSYPE